jgi:putative DNA primase/helicase
VTSGARFAEQLEEAIARSVTAPSIVPNAEPAEEAGAAEPELESVNPPVLSKAAPMDNAKAFTRDKLYRQGMCATWFHQGDWWQWNGRFYEKAPNERINGEVWHYLNGALAWTVKGGKEGFTPKPVNVEDLMKALRACVRIDDRDAPPRWIDERDAQGAEGWLVFNNCLVHAKTGEIARLTPKLWVHGGVDFDYDPGARCWRWERFLEEVFPGDSESQACVEEQLGYGMTNDTHFEKGALWIGVKRSGKTTIAWVQEQLVGAGAYASLSFHNWTRGENSRAVLLGKKVVVFPDVRLKPAKVYGLTGYDPGGLDHQSAELLLNIIGRDVVSVGVKYVPQPWQGRLPVKVIITSNEVPNLQDGGGVLASRFIKLDFKESFFGREDPTLRDQLAKELLGIANRCLAAYRRLLARGRFIQPKGGEDLERKIEERVNPFAAFMNECWVKDIDGPGVSVEKFYEVFKEWCGENGRHDLKVSVPKQKLIRYVRGVPGWEWLHSVRRDNKPRRYLVKRTTQELS